MAKRKLKFGSPAWRAKYMKKNVSTRRRRVGEVKRKRNAPNTYSRRGAAAKRKRLKQMIRANPPRKWLKVKQVRVVRKDGRDILEIKR